MFGSFIMVSRVCRVWTPCGCANGRCCCRTRKSVVGVGPALIRTPSDNTVIDRHSIARSLTHPVRRQAQARYKVVGKLRIAAAWSVLFLSIMSFVILFLLVETTFAIAAFVFAIRGLINTVVCALILFVLYCMISASFSSILALPPAYVKNFHVVVGIIAICTMNTGTILAIALNSSAPLALLDIGASLVYIPATLSVVKCAYIISKALPDPVQWKGRLGAKTMAIRAKTIRRLRILATFMVCVVIPVGIVSIITGLEFYQQNSPLDEQNVIPRVTGYALTLGICFLEWYFWIKPLGRLNPSSPRQRTQNS